MGVIFDLAYLLLLAVLWPYLLWQVCVRGKYRRDLRQRLGLVRHRRAPRPAVWIHGVSLGEINATRTLVEAFEKHLPQFEIIVSATTDTGYDRALRLYGRRCHVVRWPLDFSFSVNAALRRLRPSVVVLMELELWPNFVRLARRSGVAVVIVNGRITERRSVRRFRLVLPLARRMFGSVDLVCAQSRAYARRFVSLGCRPQCVHVTGSMKFDTAQVGDTVDGAEQLRRELGVDPSERLIVAGSTGPGEEQIVLQSYQRLLQRGRLAQLRLVIVPRKPQRFDEVARLISRMGFIVVRRSESRRLAADRLDPQAVILGDTMGELRKFYALAEVVFIGRSLAPMGGSDMIEAAALGKPTVFGPHTFNFAPAAEALVSAGAAVRIDDGSRLTEVLESLLTDRDRIARMGQLAQQLVRRQQGATERNVRLIAELAGYELDGSGRSVATPRLQVVDT